MSGYQELVGQLRECQEGFERLPYPEGERQIEQYNTTRAALAEKISEALVLARQCNDQLDEISDTYAGIHEGFVATRGLLLTTVHGTNDGNEAEVEEATRAAEDDLDETLRQTHTLSLQNDELLGNLRNAATILGASDRGDISAQDLVAQNYTLQAELAGVGTVRINQTIDDYIANTSQGGEGDAPGI